MQGNSSKESFTADMSAFVRQYKSCPDPWMRNGIDVLSHIPTGQAFLQKIEVYSPNRRVRFGLKSLTSCLLKIALKMVERSEAKREMQRFASKINIFCLRTKFKPVNKYLVIVKKFGP
jgi:hypothetical protein